MKRKPRKIIKGFSFTNLNLPKFDTKTWILLGMTFFLLLLNLIILPMIKRPKTIKISQVEQNEIRQVIQSVLETFDIPENDVTKLDTLTQIVTANEFPFFNLYKTLKIRVEEVDGEILDCIKQGKRTVIMTIGKNGTKVVKLAFVTSDKKSTPTREIALLLDDFGYSFSKMIRDFLTIDVPLTISIIPGLQFTGRVAEVAQVNKKEILVHMPMEPLYEKFDDDGFAIYCGQRPEVTSIRIKQAFSQIPSAIGMNNHQGSKATADEDLMQNVMSTIKYLDKSFVDSRTTANSVAYRIAKQTNVPCAESSMFLDNQDDPDYIQNQIENLLDIVNEKNWAIAIGHARKNTIEVLTQKIPELKAMGIDFVYVSDVLN